MLPFKSSVTYEKITDYLESTLNISWMRVTQNATGAYRFIQEWDEKYNLEFPIKYKMRSSLYVSLVLQNHFSRENVQTFYPAISLVRYWNNCYDEKQYPLDELRLAREQVFHGGEDLHPVAAKLRPIYLDNFSAFINSENPIKQGLFQKFQQSFSDLLDGFEFESQLTEKDITPATLGEYMGYARRSIALSYVLYLMALVSVETEQDLAQFEEIIPFEPQAAEAIRLANDIVSYEREVEEGKLNYPILYMMVHQQSHDEATEHVLQMIWHRLSYLDNNLPHRNEHADLLRRIMLFAVRQYFVMSFLY